MMLVVFLYLCCGFFGLISQTRIFTFIYFMLFLCAYTKKCPFSTPLLLLFVSYILSIISCYFYHDQSLLATSLQYTVFSAIFIYFGLIKFKIEPHQLERVIFWMFVIFCFCYIYQIIVYPKAVFISDQTELNETLDVSLRRMRMSGMSLAGLGIFYSLNKVLLNHKKYVAPLVLGAVVMLLFGFRTLLAFSILFALILNFRINGFSKKLFLGIILLGLFILGFSYTEFGKSVVDHMLERQENDTFSNSDYIRYTTLWHFLFDHFQSPLEYFMGSGIADRSVRSAYTLYYEKLESMGIHYYDWGILGMSWMMGFLSLVAMIWYPIKAFFTKLPKDKLYLSVWFGYLLFCAFTSAEFVRPGCFLTQGMCLYLIYIYSHEKNYIGK